MYLKVANQSDSSLATEEIQNCTQRPDDPQRTVDDLGKRGVERAPIPTAIASIGKAAVIAWTFSLFTAAAGPCSL